MALMLALAVFPQQQVSGKGFSEATRYGDNTNFLTGRKSLTAFQKAISSQKNDLTRLLAINNDIT